MLETLAAGASGAWGPIIGSFVGLFGGMFNKWMAFKVQRLQNEDNINKRAHDKEMATIQYNREITITKLEGDLRMAQTTLEGEQEIEKIDLGNLGISIGADKSTYMAADAQSRSKVVMYAMAFVDFVRGLVRPVLTAALTWAVWELNVTLIDLLQSVNAGGLPTNIVIQLTIIGVVTVFTLATTAVGYWFGSRPTVLKKMAEVIPTTR